MDTIQKSDLANYPEALLDLIEKDLYSDFCTTIKDPKYNDKILLTKTLVDLLAEPGSTGWTTIVALPNRFEDDIKYRYGQLLLEAGADPNATIATGGKPIPLLQNIIGNVKLSKLILNYHPDLSKKFYEKCLVNTIMISYKTHCIVTEEGNWQSSQYTKEELIELITAVIEAGRTEDDMAYREYGEGWLMMAVYNECAFPELVDLLLPYVDRSPDSYAHHVMHMVAHRGTKNFFGS